MRARLWLLGLAVLLSGACGVGTDDGVEAIDAGDVPFGLLEPDRVPVAAPRPGAATVVDLYLYDPEARHLVPVLRRVEATGLDAVVAELESGPSEPESAIGLQSALAEVDAVIGVELVGAAAAVDLAESFTELGGTEQRVALAQLVFSLTGRPGVDELLVTIEGEQVGVPRADGTVTGDAVERADYESLAPP